ncbi:MAG TPA: hypothetical protein VHO46_07990 [Bacteroidales bacterium]|nr:hypothetical protein [Bacteroidales bacterium]
MKIIGKFKEVIGIIVIILILVVVRLSGKGFMPDAEKWALPSLNRSNIVNIEEAEALKGEKFVIYLDDEGTKFPPFQSSVNIKPSSITDKGNIRMIRKNNGPVLLYSADPSVSAGVWMVLSQMGIKNLYILSDSKDDEVIKNEFRPDSTIRPESQSIMN